MFSAQIFSIDAFSWNRYVAMYLGGSGCFPLLLPRRRNPCILRPVLGDDTIASPEPPCCRVYGTLSLHGGTSFVVVSCRIFPSCFTAFRAKASRLKSLNSCRRAVTPLDALPNYTRMQIWNNQLTDAPAANNFGLYNAAESLLAGSDQPWLSWRSLNRLCTGVVRAKISIRPL